MRRNKRIDRYFSSDFIRWNTEKEAFLASFGNPKTSTAYRAALNRLEEWAKIDFIDLFKLTSDEARMFISDLNHEYNFKSVLDASSKERSDASVSMDTAAASSFYTWLHSRNAVMSNPFFGRERPQRTIKRITLYTSLVEDIIGELPAYESSAVAVLAFHGLKIGALRSFIVDGDQFSYLSKGRYVTGQLHPIALDAIGKAGLSKHAPFAGKESNTLGTLVKRAVNKICSEYGYKNVSCQDFRDFFAVTEYEKDNDVKRVSKLLDHASVSVTRTYLRRLGLITELTRAEIARNEKASLEFKKHDLWFVSEILEEDDSLLEIDKLGLLL